ncbi:MAG: sulfite exporter TauE/SafE family protein [Oscillospiraceae bacterium]|nr:sulfite exporter TauE/SafE family protein [Oscillospiraceae bacterium]MBQ4539396.1 sulfite exporter TauE/SafE family protein [Oscillospiraceae bacterium]
MGPLEFALLIAFSVLGAVVQSTTGFGFAVTLMSVIPHFMDSYLVCTALSSLGGLFISLMVTIKNFRKANFKIMVAPIIGYATACGIAVPLSKRIPTESLSKALGVVLIIASIYFIFFNNKFKMKPCFRNGLIAGAVAGAGAALFAVAGPPMVIYFISTTDDKDIYRATSLAFFTMSSLYSSTMRVINGIITLDVMMIFLPMLAAIALGFFIGNKIFAKINIDMLKKLVYGFMAISGLTMLF